MDTIELLRTLSEAHGVPGHEDEVREIVAAQVEPLVDEMRTDALGNLICLKRGRSDDILLLDAHMDEVGFLVGYIEPSGFLRLTPVGGWDARVLPSHAVTVKTRDGARRRGVIGSLPPHVLRPDDRSRAVSMDELFVDVGATSALECRDMGVRLGDPVVPGYPFEHINDDLVMGKAFDDRAGCTVLLKTLEALRDEQTDLTIAATFTVCEEVGLRGVRTAAYQVRPKVALALEGTTAVDVPGVPPARRPAAMGAGPAISISDTGLIAHPKVVRLLEELADANGIGWQHKLPGFGNTDASAIHITAEGSMCGVASVPCRYIHTPLSMLSLHDLEATIRLVTEFVRSAAPLLD